MRELISIEEDSYQGRSPNRYAHQQDILSKIQSMDEHKIPLEELVFRLGSSLQVGMTTETAVQRNLTEGDNQLPHKHKTPTWVQFLKQLTNWFAIMLWLAALLSLIVYIIQPIGNTTNLYLPFVLMVIIVLTGMITFTQNREQEDSEQNFYKRMLPSVTRVLRDGKMTQIPLIKLVRGDIVDVISGEKIPADIRILQSIEMKIDNSPITGELQLIIRSPECTHPEEPFETNNLAFFCTICKEGRGRGIVINTGKNTVMGQIHKVNTVKSKKKSFLREETDRLVLIITRITVVLTLAFLLWSKFVAGYSWLQCAIIGVGVLVANVPQGLLACITISLSITAKKLVDKQVLAKNLQVMETLSSVSCICADKTGLITKNRMVVQSLWYDGKIVRGHSKEEKGVDFAYEYNVQDPSFKALHHAAIICSEAVFDLNEELINTQNFKYADAPVVGDYLQAAIIKFYQPYQDIIETRSLYPVVQNLKGQKSKIYYNSSNKYSLSIVRQKDHGNHFVSYIKGDPQKIWNLCGRICYQGKYKPIDEHQTKKFQAFQLKLAKDGEKMVAFAMLPLEKEIFHENFNFNTSTPDKYNFPTKNYIFVGMISMMDPPKDSVSQAIKRCQSAGIKVIMVTGTQVPIAAAIAKKIGIFNFKTNQDFKEEGFSDQEALDKASTVVISGDMIDKAFEQNQKQGMQILAQWCEKPEIVFAEIRPSQKLLIVKANQYLGHMVGITDDGYFTPAVVQGDIGISMGISGSDVTKEACDMILLNDEFSSIVDAVQEGRNFFDNLKKMIVYLLTGNTAKIWPFAALVFLQIPLPLSNILMLCISIGTDIYPALSLIYEEAEVDVMTRKPRKKTEEIVSLRLLVNVYGQVGEIGSAGAFLTYFVIMQVYGFPPWVVLFLLGKEVMLPVNQVLGYEKVNVNGSITTVPIYQFEDGNSVDFQYTFNGTQTPYNGTAPLDAGRVTGLGYFGYHAIASPQFVCHPLNINNAFTRNFPNWLSTINSKIDLRAFYVSCQYDPISLQYYYQRTLPDQIEVLPTISSQTNSLVAYTTEALQYAQSGYFVTVVMVQWSNLFACKSRKYSFIYSGVNKHIFGSIACETFIFIILLYVPGINGPFGGRPLDFFLLGIPGLFSSMLLLCWDETRKKLISMVTSDGNRNWWARNILW